MCPSSEAMVIPVPSSSCLSAARVSSVHGVGLDAFELLGRRNDLQIGLARKLWNGGDGILLWDIELRCFRICGHCRGQTERDRNGLGNLVPTPYRIGARH
jgi:hypothetical protein